MIVNEDYILVANLGTDTVEDAVLEYKKPSATEFEAIIIDPPVHCGFNYFNFPVPKENLLEPGTYIFRISGYELEVFETREALPKPLSSVPAPALCIVTGNVRTLSGQAEVFENIEVVLRPLKLPLVISGNLTLGRRVRALTDFDGFFSVPAIRGAQVVIEIKDAGIRFECVIPDQDTVRIEELIP